MQDLYAERMQLFDRLMDELQALRNSGSQYAENEAENRKALRVAILEERSKGTPVTVISDLCRGREDIAELKQRRDCSEALYKASQEAINVFKLKIRTVDEDMKRTTACGIAGTRSLRFANAFARYRNAIGLRESCSVKELAQMSSDSAENVRKNVKKMLAKGLFKQAALDEQSGLLLMTPEAYERHEQKLAAEREAERQQALARSANPGEPAALTAEQKRLLDRGRAFIATIREGNDAISGEGISRTLDQIEHVVGAILDAAAEDPSRIDDLDRLLDYYLPTTVKLLDSYRELDAQPIQSESILASKREIESALERLNAAFEKLLDTLFRDMAIDVSSDISVLNAVLAQEGLTDSPFDKASKAR